MQKKIVKKALSYLLTAVIIMGSINLSPMATVEAQAAETAKNVNLNVSNDIAGIKNPEKDVTEMWTGSKVYLGNKLWRVLSKNHVVSGKNPDNTYSDYNAMFLFSEGFLTEGRVYHSLGYGITWEGCQLRKNLNGYAGSTENLFTSNIPNAIEQNAIITSHIENPDNPTYHTEGGEDTDDKLFLLSLDEVQNSLYGMPKTETGSTDYNRTRADANGNDMQKRWWLRSPGFGTDYAADVSSLGNVYYNGSSVTQDFGRVRPALNLNLSKVLFSYKDNEAKPITFDKTSECLGNTWRLTLQGGTGFSAARVAGETGSVEAGDTMHVNVSSVGTPDLGVSYTRLSAMLVETNGTVAAYGRLKDGATTESNLEVTIPSGIANGNYTLKVFAEDVNTGNETDYASSMADISITVGEIPNPNPTPIPNPTPTPEQKEDNDNKNTEESSSKENENTYVNPLKWRYPQNQPESLVLPEQQGPVCAAAFKLATPKGYKEALSLNLLLHNKAGYDSKQKTLTIYIPDEYLKSGRTFALIGIDKYGKTHYFTDTDLKADSITINIEGFEGYAFDLIYKD
ncbi:MAG: DUF6273 domain-containing protein [bacterium]|nr:DUF6273 domain-containing protein [bacterium]